MEGTEGKKINELKDRTLEITQSEQHGENRIKKKMKRAARIYGTISDLTFISSESQREGRKEGGAKKILEEIWLKCPRSGKRRKCADPRN